MKGNVLLLAGAIVIVSLLVTLNLFFSQSYQDEMASQFSKQQLILAETISTDIRRDLEHFGAETASLARVLGDVSLQRPDLGEFVMGAFASGVRADTLALKIYDARGELLYSNKPGAPTSADVKLLELVPESSTGSAALFKNPYEHGVSFVSPIIKGGQRVGSIILEVPVQTITERFLTPLKTAGPSNVWMMDQGGTLLYHPLMPEMVGKNLYRTDESCFQCHQSFEVEKNILDSTEIAVQSYIAPFGEDKIIASARTVLSPAYYWITAVSIPYSEVTASLRRSMRLHSILIVAIFASTGLTVFILLIINRKRLLAEEHSRHEAELEHYAHELENAVEKRTLELISEKEKLDAIVGSLDAGLFLADKNKKIIWVNRTMRSWFEERSLKELTMDDIYGGTEVQSSIVDNRVIQELVYHKIGRREGYFQITSTPLADVDGNMQLLGLIHDVTEIKKFEEQMGHSEKLSALGRLTAGIAHEIGNPLTAVSSFLQILRESEDDEFKIKNLDTILFHINRIADTVRQLSVLSKLPGSEMKETQINDVIETSLGLLQFDKRASAVAVKKELSPLPPIVTDSSQLSQVFVNLILNALDAMPAGGALSIRSLDGPAHITIEFEDTGPGIGEQNINRVFDPFFTTKEKGTGLGLSVSYGIIKKLGGELTVRNLSPEGGACFSIQLPKDAKDANEANE